MSSSQAEQEVPEALDYDTGPTASQVLQVSQVPQENQAPTEFRALEEDPEGSEEAQDLEADAKVLPLTQYLPRACLWAKSLDLPEHDQQFFQFMRALKGHMYLENTGVDEAFKLVTMLARQFSLDLRIGDFDIHEEDGEVAFYSMWERVRFPLGSDPVAVACEAAGEGRLITQRNRKGRYSVFLTVAALLQIQVRQRPILLPVRKMAKHLECQGNTANAWGQWAMADGVLIKTRSHKFRSKNGPRAAEYVMGLHLWDRNAIDDLAERVQIPVRAQDLEWIADKFRLARCA